MTGGKERKLNRWQGYDYSMPGFYYVTICTKNRICYFGEVKGGKMILNDFGKIAQNFWQQIPEHFKNCHSDEFIVMPNHLHGIIEIFYDFDYSTVGNTDLRSLQKTQMLLPKIIHGFKSSVTRKINKIQNQIYFQWQKSFHDRVIRNEEELINIRYYIQQNPGNWHEDRNNPKNI
ncbi:MAG TPA: transposase [Candidatus Uhrbacteria bacterium]|nr:transposase [Candidatus Uhrbacteria bacterium]